MAELKCYGTCPINRGNRSIRLFRLLESSDADLIRCEMTCFDLQSCPPYSALSYTWGSNGAATVIHVNKVRHTIQQNLSAFLKERRKIDDDEFYWVDALCINQADIEERNHQVGLMREIYSNAKTVYVWLGAKSQDSNIAMDYIKGFRSGSNSMTRRNLWSSAEGRGLLNLCQLPYWRRVWIVQEIILARNLIICCGDRVVSWAQLEAITECVKLLEDNGRIQHHIYAAGVLESDAVRVVESKRNWRSLQFESDAIALEYLLSTYHDMESSEIRDRVYGFLGLAEHAGSTQAEIPLHVDYSLTKGQLFLLVYDWLQNTPQSRGTSAKLGLIDRLSNLLRVVPQDSMVEAAKTEAVSGLRNEAIRPWVPSSFRVKTYAHRNELGQEVPLFPNLPLFTPGKFSAEEMMSIIRYFGNNPKRYKPPPGPIFTKRPLE